MQEGQNRPSFGNYLLRVLSIALGIFLLIFIVWGIMKLVESSNFWADLFRIILFVGIPLLIGIGIFWLIRLARSGEVSLNLRRIIGLVAAVFVIGFIVWGIARLAETSNSDGQVNVPDNELSSTTIDEPAVGPDQVTPADGADQPADTAPASDEATDEGGQVTQNDSAASGAAAGEQVPNTGPSQSDLPNTGVESVLLSAMSLGALAYATKSYAKSRRLLKQI
jgi:hypothetical protein